MNIMLKSLLNGNVIDIEGNSTTAGTHLDAFPAKAGETLNPQQPPFANNQAWQVLPDPAGSSHHIIQNPYTGLCIDIEGNSTAMGKAIDAWPKKTSNNQNQLWDFLPDAFGSGYFFIQNPQTGYVIEIQNGSSNSGAALVVNPRRLFGNKYQLWAGVDEFSWSPTSLPALALLTPGSSLKGNYQYVLQPASALTEVIVTLDIIQDLVSEAFSVQINGNPPWPNPKNAWDTEWSQFGFFMSNNSLALFQQVWGGPNTPTFNGHILCSVPSTSAPFLTVQNNTIPAGTRIVLTLAFNAGNNFLTGVAGKAFNQAGAVIGAPQSWSAIGQNTFHAGSSLPESYLAPLGAFQVAVVGNPNVNNGVAHFNAGFGTITVNANPAVTVRLGWPDPLGGGTGESGNCYYGQLPQGSFGQIVQPFGVPSPKITTVADYSFSGQGLLPNSKLTAKGSVLVVNTSQTVNATDEDPNLTSQNDGSFSFSLQFPNNSFLYEAGILTGTISDADGNWATGVVHTPEGWATPSSSSGTGN